jgi:phenylpropionate dioxygenase-like ring-hydroxylating dioxygenase large terminal subunit
MMRVPENQWYPVLESRELRHKPLGVERLGWQLVFWRSSDGLAHAHLDRCPHLGAALSGGKVQDDRLTCPFHGFAFDSTGLCKSIPSIGLTGNIPKGIALTSFPLQEQHQFIWLWWGEPQEIYPAVPYFPQLETGWRYGTTALEWAVHYTRAIENQLDVAHLAFVHRTTIGADGLSLIEDPYVEADQHGIKVWITNAKDEGQTPLNQLELAAAANNKEPGLHFLFPGIWLLDLSSHLKNVIAFVPVNAQTTRYYLRVYHRIHIPVVAKLFEWVMAVSNYIIINQDKRVILAQTPLDSSDARQDRLVGADRAISQFRRIHARMLNMNITETADLMKNENTFL